MSKLSKLYESPEKLTLGEGEHEIEIEVPYISLEDLEHLNMGNTDNPDLSEVKKIAEHILRKSVPDATDDEISKFQIKHLGKIMEKISEMNDFGDQEGMPDHMKATVRGAVKK